MAEPLLRVEGLARDFTQGGAVIHVLRGVDLALMPGEIVALLGPSGSGKSTLLQAVGLLEGGWSGRLLLDGVDAAGLGERERTRLRREALGFVYQFHHLLPDFTALENAEMPLLVRNMPAGPARARASEALRAVGLGQRLHHRPAQLSGGEQQRVAVARALVGQPRLVLADEPTGNLDEATAATVFAELLALVRGQGAAALIATHNPVLAAACDRVVRLHEGRIAPA